jgi:hypothetical protein
MAKHIETEHGTMVIYTDEEQEKMRKDVGTVSLKEQDIQELKDSHKPEWCTCDNPDFADEGMIPDNSCVCGIGKHHVHCKNCGCIVQVG